MSSDKGKSVAIGTRRKTRPTANNAPLKQRTLFDSFVVKTSRKEVASSQATEDTAPTPEASQSLPIDQDELLENTVSFVNIDDVPPTPKVISVDSTPEPPPKVDLPRVTESIIVDYPVTICVPDQDAQAIRGRSPSVVIIESETTRVSTASAPGFSVFNAKTKSSSRQEGKTPDLPIVIDSSPIKARSTSSRSNKPIHPFFGAKPKVPTPVFTPSSKTPATQHAPQLPSFPDGNSQHVRGPQTAISGHLRMFSARISDSSQQSAAPPDFRFLLKGSAPEEFAQRPTNLMSTFNESGLSYKPQEHNPNHPAIARVWDYNPDDPLESRRPWSDKWRPTCAQEVLGNEKSALYLRDWLRALELQLEGPPMAPDPHGQPVEKAQSKSKAAKRGLKRTRVVRTVDKKRKKSRIDSEEEDDWIARTDDESDDGHTTYEETDNFDEFLLAPPVTSSPPSCPDPPPLVLQDLPNAAEEPDLGQLHNTILLVGPHGVGKTASVYACAEELGWDVFEVYPGIGRRNGANVDNLIGEVGKNHLVLQSRQSGDVLKSFFRRENRPESTPAEDLCSGYSPRKPSTSKAVFEADETTTNVTKTIRQSLILLEEVDILYKEDSNFWPTVIRIIKECKRPVICTCNDISLVPLEDLPLQSVLYFEPCHPTVAVPYLRGLCAAEGRLVQQDVVSGLYNIFSADQSSNPVTGWDLRRNINALQVLCATANSIEYANLSGNINEANGTFLTSPRSRQRKSQISMRASETLSFLDGILDLDSMHYDTIAEYAGCLPSEDDEIGHAILHDLYAVDAAQFGQYDRHEDILTTATRLSRKMFDVDVTGDAMATQAFEERAKSMRSNHRCVLKEVCPVAVWARRDGGAALEYIPLVRQMVAADDEEEARETEKKRGAGRSTRNSLRSGYVRMIEMTEEGRQILGSCGLVCS